MSSPAVLFIRLHPPGDEREKARILALITAQIDAGCMVTVLTTTPCRPIFASLPVTLWGDGAPRGLLRLLELMRRLSWAQFSAVYDLDGRFRVRAYKWFVRPCPPWHRDATFRL